MAAAVSAAIRASHRRREKKTLEEEEDLLFEDPLKFHFDQSHIPSNQLLLCNLLFVRVSSPIDNLCGQQELLQLFKILEKRNARIIVNHQQLVDGVLILTPQETEGRLTAEELAVFLHQLIENETKWPIDFLNLRYSIITFLRKLGEKVTEIDGGVNEDLLQYVCYQSLSTSSSNCTICCEKLKNDDSDHLCYQLSCSHQFHEHCIKKWLGKNTTCPLCRRHVFLSQADQAKQLQSAGLLSNRAVETQSNPTCVIT
jgi:hypothetical protein